MATKRDKTKRTDTGPRETTSRTSVASIWQRMKTDDIAKHGAIMVVLAILGGLFNYLYQLFMGIMLSPEQYGVLFSLTSLLIILGVFGQTTTLAIARFVSKLRAQGRLGGVNYLRHFYLKRTFFMGLATFLLLTALSPLISGFLKVDSIVLLVVVFSSALVVLTLSVNLGIMQGLQRFLALGSSHALVGFFKVTLGTLFVYMGLGINGGLAAIPISFAAVLVFSLLSLRTLSRAGNEKVLVDNHWSYAGLALLGIFAFTVFTNADVVLAKHYLSAVEAGNYCATSVLGRIAFYAPIGVATAMFPKTSELFESGGKHRQLFLKAAIGTAAVAGGVILTYGILPEFITELAFGRKYPLASSSLFTYALAMGFFSLSFLLMNYFLSLDETTVTCPFLVVMFLQLILAAFFHSSITQLVNVTLTCSIVSIVSMIPFCLKMKHLQSQ